MSDVNTKLVEFMSKAYDLAAAITLSADQDPDAASYTMQSLCDKLFAINSGEKAITPIISVDVISAAVQLHNETLDFLNENPQYQSKEVVTILTEVQTKHDELNQALDASGALQ